MLHENAPVTGSWENIVAMIRALVVAGLCRVDFITHEQAEYTAVRIVLGDDSEVRAYYGRMLKERDALREQAAQQTNPHVAQAMYHQASELLIRYQERSYTVNEKPYELNTNIYGWCVGSMFLSNLYGGPFAITARGKSLEGCIAFGCDLIKDKGTSLTINALKLPATIPEIADLVRLAGGTQEAIAWLLDEPLRRAARDKKAAERAKAFADQQAATKAFEVEQKQIIEAAAFLLSSDTRCYTQRDATGLTVRGKTHNPSFRLTVEHSGWKIVRTDFDGVRKEHSVIAGKEGAPVFGEVTRAVEAAWAGMRAKKATA